MSDLDKLPTEEELAAVREATKTAPRKPVEYPVHNGPRVIRIDPTTNSELPPQYQQQDTGDDSDADRDRPRKRRAEKRGGDDEFSIPDKFKNKDPEEIARSYLELEKRHGALANEVGHLRNVVERVATGKRKSDLGEEDDDSVEITSDDLLSNPTEAIRKVAERTSGKLKQDLDRIEAERQLAAFEAKYPTYQQDMNDPEFQKYFQSSAYRQRLAQRAVEGDLDAADELWMGWTEVRDQQEDRRNRDDQEFDEDFDDARPRQREQQQGVHLERGGSRGAGGDNFGKRVYSSREILEMRLNNSDLYYSDEMQRVIAQAYAEGRVK